MRRRTRLHRPQPTTTVRRRVQRKPDGNTNVASVPLVQMQRKYGNAAVQRMLATGQASMVQPFFGGMPQIQIPGFGGGQNDNENFGLPGPREAFEAALQMAGVPAQMVMDFIDRLGPAAEDIFADPIGFASNLVQALTQGFQQFATNAIEHVQIGLGDWVLEKMDELNMEVPSQFDVKAIFMFVMQILQITVQQIRARLIARFGRGAQGAINKAIELFLRSRQGLEELWDVVKGGLTQFIETIRDEFFTEVWSWVQQGVVKLITLFNPVNALVTAIQAIYQVAQILTEKFGDAAAFVGAFVNAAAQAATGAVGSAAELIGEALKTVIPQVISFMAELIGLDDIAEKIHEILTKFKRPLEDKIIKIIENMNG